MSLPSNQVSTFPRIEQTFYVADPAAVKVSSTVTVQQGVGYAENDMQEITMQRTRFPKPIWQYGILTFFGGNIVVSEFDEWKRYRKVAAPAFSEVGATTQAARCLMRP